MTDTDHDSDKIHVLLFALAAFLFVAISGYLSFIGYADMLRPTLASFLAVGASILLFITNLKLKRARALGEPVLRLWGALIVVIILTFPANFNAMWSEYMAGPLAFVNLETASQRLSKTVTDAEIAILNSRDYLDAKKLDEEVISERNKLVAQILSPRNEGFGTLAAGHKARLSELLGTDLPYLERGSPAEKADAYSNVIDKERETRIYPRIRVHEDLVERIKTAWKDAKKAAAKVRQENDAALTRNHIDAIAQVNQTIGEDTRRHLSGQFDYKQVVINDYLLGNINHSFRSAFGGVVGDTSSGTLSVVSQDHTVAVFLITALSLGIDLILPLYSMLAFHAPRNRPSGPSHHSNRARENGTAVRLEEI